MQYRYNDSTRYVLDTTLNATGRALDTRSKYYDSTIAKERPYLSVAEVEECFPTVESREGQFFVVINTGGTLTNGVVYGGTNQLWFWKEANGPLQLWVSDINTITKASLGLDQVDNTSDINKPLSIATEAALITHTHNSSSIVDFTEAVQDAVAGLLGAGSNMTLTYNDATNSFIIDTAGEPFDPERVRDAIGAAIVGAGVISVTINDAGDTITISSTATVNSTDAQLRDRTTHTGVQPQSSITNLEADLASKATNVALSFKADTATVAAGLMGQGAWNASTNTPTLSATPLSTGKYYEVSVAGTSSIPTGGSITYSPGDKLVSNGAIWQHIPIGTYKLESLDFQHLTRTVNTDGIISGGTVKWSNGSNGVLTNTDYNADLYCYDGFTVTYAISGKTVTQPKVTRNDLGVITIQPQLIIS